MTAINTRHMPAGDWRLWSMDYLQAYHPSITQTKISHPRPASTGAADLAVATQPANLELQLFDNAAALKITMSGLAMHLPDHWRVSIRKQIDRLLAVDDWEDESSLITGASFASFLRFVLHARPASVPSLGVGHTGHLLASWRKHEMRTSIEFFPDGTALAILILPTEHDRPELRDEEVLTWQGRVENLKGFIERNRALECLEGTSKNCAGPAAANPTR